MYNFFIVAKHIVKVTMQKNKSFITWCFVFCCLIFYASKYIALTINLIELCNARLSVYIFGEKVTAKIAVFYTCQLEQTIKW